MSNYSARSANLRTETVESGVTRALARMACFLRGKLQTFVLPHTHHSERFVQAQLSGERAMSLETFVEDLRAVKRAGRQNGREHVRQIGAELFAEFGISLALTEDYIPKPPKDELCDVTDAAARLHVVTCDALSDGFVTNAEACEVAARAQRLAMEAAHVPQSI